MSLQARIIADMKEAMRAKDQPRLEAVRLLRAAIQRREVDERIELDDDGVLTIVQKMIKQGRDAIEQFERGKRSDLVDSETKTLKVLEVYLPKQLDESEIEQLLDQAMGETGADSQRDMGKVMGWLRPRIQGRADMGSVSSAVKQRLSA
ncbi:MAG: GatB/YqeY domain-containing protein [Pseudomonadota bacterium]|nr:GatB/YqeY domain-containing protein [Pseudomonadota bacterium]MEE3288127.1 GatB/YqeY domain-containing protein [Pseudomonadota bacterium]